MHVLDTITITFAGLMVGNEPGAVGFRQSCCLAAHERSASAGSISSRSFTGAGDACLVWFVSSASRARVVPASPLGCLGPSAYGDTDLGRRHRLYDHYACAHQRPHCFLELSGVGSGWSHDHKKWDSLHRVRILLLAAAFFALTYALVA